jgi:hypothetical protein
MSDEPAVGYQTSGDFKEEALKDCQDKLSAIHSEILHIQRDVAINTILHEELNKFYKFCNRNR